MYEGFFGLSARPFHSIAPVDHYVAVPTTENARRTVRRAVERGEGPTLVLGPAGSGKTLLCRTLARDLAPEFDVVMLANCLPTLGRRELLQSVLFELGLPYKGLDEGELRLAIVETLLDGDAATRPVVLFVDEAHLLPVPLLDELRQLGDVVVGGRPRMQLVLSGTIALEETFAHPHLEAFNQRIAARCYLTPLSRDDSRQLLANRMLAAGKSLDSVFTAEAVENLYRASDGVPRLLTQMADYALVLGATKGKRRIDGALIEECWSDLQQLPPPWADSRSSRKLAEVQRAQHSAIEFGVLDEPAAPSTADASEPTFSAPATLAQRDATSADSPPRQSVVETGEWSSGFASIEFGELPAESAPAPVAQPIDVAVAEEAVADDVAAEFAASVLDEPSENSAPLEFVEILEAAEPLPLSVDGFYLEATVVVDRYARIDAQTPKRLVVERPYIASAAAAPLVEAKPVAKADAMVTTVAVVAPQGNAAASRPALHIADESDAVGEAPPAPAASARERRDAAQPVVAPVRRSEYRRMFARLLHGQEPTE